jgi:hypothetical protein
MFVHLRSFDNYIPAHIMLQRLEEEGIRAYLQNENTITINPFLSNAIDGIKLMVYKDQAERALDLVTKFENEYQQSGACPACGSLDVQRTSSISNNNRLITMLGKPVSQAEYTFHCDNCGYTFSY